MKEIYIVETAGITAPTVYVGSDINALKTTVGNALLATNIIVQHVDLTIGENGELRILIKGLKINE